MGVKGAKNEFQSNRSLSINEHNFMNNPQARDRLTTKTYQTKNADYYVKKAYHAFYDETNNINRNLLKDINPNTKEGLQKFAGLYARGTLEENDELYENLKQASKAYKRLSEEERKASDWKKVYEKSGQGQAYNETDWENYFANALKTETVDL